LRREPPPDVLDEVTTVFGHAIDGLGRLGRQALVVLTWASILIALMLATWTTITSGRAQEPGDWGAVHPASGRPATTPARAQPAFSNQNVSGR
jgi:hypothetical protein